MDTNVEQNIVEETLTPVEERELNERSSCWGYLALLWVRVVCVIRAIHLYFLFKFIKVWDEESNDDAYDFDYGLSPIPLMLAVETSNVEEVQFLLNNGARVGRYHGTLYPTDTALTRAIEQFPRSTRLQTDAALSAKCHQVLDLLLANCWEGDVDEPDMRGDTPLNLAARRGNVLAAWKLLEYGANMFAGDAHGRTPCEMAVVNNCASMVELFCLYGYNKPMPLDNLYDAVNKHRWHLAGVLVAWNLCTPDEKCETYGEIFLLAQSEQQWGLAKFMLGYHPQCLLAFLSRRMEWVAGNEQHYARLMSAVGIASATSLISLENTCMLSELAAISRHNSHARGEGELEIPEEHPVLMRNMWRMWGDIVAAVTEEHWLVGWDEFASLHQLY